MRILIGNKEHFSGSRNVDLGEAVLLSDEQRDAFIQIMKNLFEVVIVEPRIDYRDGRLGEGQFQRKWTDEEIDLLYKVDDDMETTCRKLGRSFMSVDIKRGSHIAEFTAIAAREGLNLTKDTKKIIELYREELKEKRRIALVRRKTLKDETKQLRKKIKENEMKKTMLKLLLDTRKSPEEKTRVQSAISRLDSLLEELKNSLSEIEQ